jgi:hypothetical protein
MRGLAALIFALVIAAVVGFGAYQLGLAQGVGAVAAPGAVAPAYYYHPFYGGFGFFGFLFPLLFIFLIFGLMRAAWGGRGRYGSWGGYGEREARLEEWHKRMHGEGNPPPTAPSGR